MTPRINIATTLCQALDDAELPWAITHGAEGFPERIGRDFDILLPESFHRQAVTLAKEVAVRHGWGFCLIPLKWAGAPVFLWKWDNGILHNFEIHFINHIDWGGCLLADGELYPTPAVRIHGLSIATWPAFAKRVLIQILAGCWERIKERPRDFVIHPQEEEHLEAPMNRLFGRKAGKQILELIRTRNIDAIIRRATIYRMYLLSRMLLPVSGGHFSARWFHGKIQRTLGIAPWCPPILVVVASPNDSDKARLYLEQIVSHLGFAKVWILPDERPTSFLAQAHLQWKIRLHRSLFRLLATTRQRSHVLLDNCSLTHRDTDFFFVDMDSTIIRNKPVSPNTEYASDINASIFPNSARVAYNYLENLSKRSQNFL